MDYTPGPANSIVMIHILKKVDKHSDHYRVLNNIFKLGGNESTRIREFFNYCKAHDTLLDLLAEGCERVLRIQEEAHKQ